MSNNNAPERIYMVASPTCTVLRGPYKARAVADGQVAVSAEDPIWSSHQWHVEEYVRLSKDDSNAE
jgi:hypothetical protein